MAQDYDPVERMAAEALAANTGMSTEAALNGIAFQNAATRVMDDLDQALGDASADVWFDWSDGHGRLKIGITTRVETATIDAVRTIVETAGLIDRTDFVKVVWNTQELEAAQERAWKVLEPAFPHKPLMAARDPEATASSSMCRTI